VKGKKKKKQKKRKEEIERKGKASLHPPEFTFLAKPLTDINKSD